MKYTHLLILAIITTFTACNDNDLIEEEPTIPVVEVIPNHLKATINGVPHVIYQVDSLNTAGYDDLYFSFGRKITTYLADNSKDTAFFINASINQKQLMVQFPYNGTPQLYEVKRQSYARYQLALTYNNMSHFKQDSGYYSFQSNFYPKEKLAEIKVGELEVTKVDWEKRQVAGKFEFDGHGYFNDWRPKGYTKVIALDSIMHITEGTFFYEWDEDLEINPDDQIIEQTDVKRVETKVFGTTAQPIKRSKNVQLR
ncbi:hypothetical protein EMN47_00205 [Prolixibacteraceae bacterium JC049]|nr:hypothetical protein [Prolixibacteraceae bacterium JC049]